MQIEINVSDVTLDSIVHDGDGEYARTERLADIVADRMVQRFIGDHSDEYQAMAREVYRVRESVIRELVTPVITEAIEKSVQKTNTYGEPIGPAVSLREVIVDEAKKMLSTRGDYGRGDSLVQKVIKDAVGSALRNELATVLKEEKDKVVAAVRAQAATLIADAVAKGVGR